MQRSSKILTRQLLSLKTNKTRNRYYDRGPQCVSLNTTSTIRCFSGIKSEKQAVATIPNFKSVAEDSDLFYASSETTKSVTEWDTDLTRRKWTPQLTKIVATIGPTSEQLEVLQNVVRGGMRIMRLNFSHATVEEVELRVKNLKACKVSNFSDLT